MNPQVLNFFREALNRLRTRSPRFFYILQLLGGSMTLAGKLPTLLDRWTTMHISPEFVNVCNDIAKFSLGFLMATFLSAETKPTAVTQEGDVLKKLDETKYPFTATSEKKKAARHETPVVEDPLPK